MVSGQSAKMLRWGKSEIVYDDGLRSEAAEIGQYIEYIMVYNMNFTVVETNMVLQSPDRQQTTQSPDRLYKAPKHYAAVTIACSPTYIYIDIYK